MACPRRALASRGYPVNSSGLMQAIKQGDALGAELFARIDLPVERAGGTLLLLSGPQPWNPKVADALSPAMFRGSEACVHPLFSDDVKEPVDERLRAYVRLCGKEKLSAYLNDSLSKPQPANADSGMTAKRKAQQRNLAILNSMS